MDKIEESAKLIANAKCLCVFTGAGVSKESGIPTFRGSEDSVYENYDQSMLDPSVNFPSLFIKENQSFSV